jgi:hypothetical protein
MKKSLLLSAALVATLQLVPAAEAYAQGVQPVQPNTRAARRAREQAKNPAANVPQKYPKATREAPKQAGEPALAKSLEALIALQGKEDAEGEIIAKADSLLANGRANAYDKSTAAYLAGSAAMSRDSKDNATPARYYKQAIELGGLDNNNHYLAMLQLAQLLDADGKQEEALTWVDRFLAETQSDDPTALAIKNQVLMGMDKPELALEFLEKQAAAKPDDTRTQMNLASAYLDAGKETQALALLEKLRKAGKFTEPGHYEAAWRLLANTEGKEKEALVVIDEGIAKGILKPSYDTYIYQAQTWYTEGDTDKAIGAWQKAAPLGKDGQASLALSQALSDKERWAEAKAAARSALDKGVTKPGVAWQVLYLAESGLGNKAAATAAAREAAKYPETKKWADGTLRASGGK